MVDSSALALQLTCGLDANGDSLLALVHPEDRERFGAAVSHALNNGGTLDLKCRLVLPAPSSRWAAESAALISAAAAPSVRHASMDAHAARAQPLPPEGEGHYRRFFEEDVTGDFLVAPAGTILECNPAFVQILGCESAEEVLHHSFARFFPQPDAWERLLEALRKEGRIRGMEVELQRRDGASVHVIMSVLGLFDEAEHLQQIQGYLVDVTQHKRVEEQLRHAQKMEAVGRLAGRIAHDFNNFLMAIQGNLEMVLADLDTDSPVREDLEEIRNASNRAAALVHQLLSLNRRQPSQPVVLDLNATIANLEEMLRRLIGEDIELIARYDPHLGYIRADPGQIEQVIVNLVVNARDAMPDGGRLIIEGRNCDLGDAETRPFSNHLRAGPYVEIRITDNGSGMDGETLSRVFEPFFTTKGKGKGTGLGLTTVYGIIKQSGGWVRAESTPGKGSTFCIYLPRVEECADSALPHALSAGAAPAGSETILVVEDDDSLRALARRVLQKSGYHVLEAADGNDALQICEQHEDTIHLLLTDMVLRKGSGRELAERATALRPGLKVIATSGYTDERGGVTGEQPGRASLQKPFTPEQLATTVRKVLNGLLLTT